MLKKNWNHLKQIPGEVSLNQTITTMGFGQVAQNKLEEKWGLIAVACSLAGFVGHFLQSQVKAILKPEFIFTYCSDNATKTMLFPFLLSILISVTPRPPA